MLPYEYYSEQTRSRSGIQNPCVAYVRVRGAKKLDGTRLAAASADLEHLLRQQFFGAHSRPSTTEYGVELDRILHEIIPDTTPLRAPTHIVELGIRRDDSALFVYHKFPVRFSLPGTDRLMKITGLAGAMTMAIRSLPQPAKLKFSDDPEERELLQYRYSKACTSALVAEWISQRGLKESLTALTLKNG